MCNVVVVVVVPPSFQLVFIFTEQENGTIWEPICFEIFFWNVLGSIEPTIVENAHAYCVQIMKIIMFWNVWGRAHCICFVQKFWLALWRSLPIFLIGTLPCTMNGMYPACSIIQKVCAHLENELNEE
jgi:hypothetical protein